MSLPVVRATLRLIRDKYVDPNRLVPSTVLLGALRQIEREVLPVVVSKGDSATTFTVHVGSSQRAFRIDDVQGLWDVAARLREVFVFLRAELGNDRRIDFKNLEHAACTGLLASVDRHDEFMAPPAPATATLGNTAGAGVAVSIRNRMLVLTRVLPSSAAARAGLRARDLITKIDDKFVFEMTLDDAIDRLRGPVGSRMELLVRRTGSDAWEGERQFVVTREERATSPIEARNLGRGIHYVRIKRFQRATAQALGQILARFRQEGSLDGLVLDLRDNSGGLLDEAAKVADAFLEEGPIATVQGASEGQEEKVAKKDETEPQCPLVVLTNSLTASGSELVAGALKKNERAVIVGETSFGAGRIQLLFFRIAGEAAIKLTIAEFQAPAGTPIQDVGVVPDVALRPVVVDAAEMHFFGPSRRLREHDPMQIFPSVAVVSQPAATVWYEASFIELPERVDIGDPGLDQAQSDFSLRFAAELVAQLPKGQSSQQIKSARAIIESRQAREMSAITARLKAIGIDWQSPPGTKGSGPRSSEFEVRATTDRQRNTAAAGEAMTLAVAVTNRSRTPAYRLRAITKSDNDDYDDKELLFGRIDPGQTVTRRIPLGQCEKEWHAALPVTPAPGIAQRGCHLSTSGASREDIVRVIFGAEGGDAPSSAELRPTVTVQPKPLTEPSIEVAPIRLAYRDGRVRIEGTAKSRDGVLDVCVFNNEHKVFYQLAASKASPFAFAFDASLEPGINVFRVLVRDRNEVSSSRTIVTRSDGPRGEPLAALRYPKREAELSATFATFRSQRSPAGPTSPRAKSCLWSY